jgi:HAD superfamily hydrolase (TIGR01509 family)
VNTDRLPQGVVFDCDGTLADTESLSARAWREVLGRRGLEATPEDHAAIIGRAWPAGFEHYSTRAELGDRDAFRAELRAFAADLYAEELELFPDAVATLLALREADVPVAVASSSSREHVRRCLVRGDLLGHVTAIVGADDVRDHKPHPEPYLAAAAALGLGAERCTAVEDTPIGVASARAAGSFTVAVVRGVLAEEELSAADRVVTELDPAALIPPTGWTSSAA